ncbi:MAG: YifB family Mg chelatase-like AAA ATPase [Lactobacillales bacterium]|jgi:magnesium chelatase family protein|nr:YifB family Mg chelatase-like AAA ATPase [Lactobacillales bacterium]
MVARTYSVAFSGINVLKIGIEVQLGSGLPAFAIVGLADKAIAESKERVRAALHSMGLSLPAKRITVNLAPADVLKEGTHYDLPIAMAVIAAMGIVPAEVIHNYMMLGELGLDATIRPVSGILPASVAAKQHDMGFVCPMEQGGEAAWSNNDGIIAPHTLLQLINHFKGQAFLSAPVCHPIAQETAGLDFGDVKGQESAKRVLEIAAVGGHNVLMVGPPGSGKSMLASRMPSIMPPMTPEEILQVSQIHSVAGLLKDGRLVTQRPFRSPHHSASTPAMVGGGLRTRPGEISLAHRGILFLDELPEFNRSTLETLRQPLETGVVSVARVNSHITYPARFQLIAAMNPCRCGYLGVKGHECARAPKCADEYQSKISGPLLDRIDLYIDVPSVAPWELGNVQGGESSKSIQARVLKAVDFSKERFKGTLIMKNGEADGTFLEEIALLTDEARQILIQAAEKWMLSGRGYHRIMRVARSIADLDQSGDVKKHHMTEALSYRKSFIKSE